MTKMKRNTNYYFLGVLVVLSVCLGSGVTSCKKSKNKVTPVCDGTNATYSNTVQAIVSSNCVSCHSGYSSYSGLSTITTNGQFAKHVLTDQDMPENGSLTSDQLNKLQCWVNNGYPQ